MCRIPNRPRSCGRRSAPRRKRQPACLRNQSISGQSRPQLEQHAPQGRVTRKAPRPMIPRLRVSQGSASLRVKPLIEHQLVPRSKCQLLRINRQPPVPTLPASALIQRQMKRPSRQQLVEGKVQKASMRVRPPPLHQTPAAKTIKTRCRQQRRNRRPPPPRMHRSRPLQRRRRIHQLRLRLRLPPTPSNLPLVAEGGKVPSEVLQRDQGSRPVHPLGSSQPAKARALGRSQPTPRRRRRLTRPPLRQTQGHAGRGKHAKRAPRRHRQLLKPIRPLLTSPPLAAQLQVEPASATEPVPAIDPMLHPPVQTGPARTVRMRLRVDRASREGRNGKAPYGLLRLMQQPHRQPEPRQEKKQKASRAGRGASGQPRNNRAAVSAHSFSPRSNTRVVRARREGNGNKQTPANLHL